MIVSQFGIIKTIPKGAVLNVRREGDGYQVITGEFAGKHIEPGKCIEITQEQQLSVAEWNEMEQGYLKIIRDLEDENKSLKEKCSGYEDDKKLTEFLLKTTVKALTRIHELKQEKEPQNG